ncbi:hypothetical protein TEA_029602 [Camellia sinensis var. sinensis]|uniref:Uncharacterized protein n=1 Tax=Camellia sinensis var. sinensis TaxID=542762 RepID=A0A4S4DQ09_CAMSN|nr:hypothetical protein TEA_029602 [Camellia sinensis var. sinensis]
MEPFPSSAFKVLILIFATATKIRSNGRSARACAQGFAATAAPSYSSGPGACPDGRVSAQLGTVTRLLVHPASPVLLTKNGPLGALDSVARLNGAAAPSYLFKYRCGTPPEFPLASPRSSTVHHLSGPDRHARTRTLLRRSRSVDGATLVRVSRQAEWGARRLAPGARRCRSTLEAARCQPRSGRRHLRGLFDCPGFGLLPDPHRSTPQVDRRTGWTMFHIRPGCIASPHLLPSRQFQALFDSLFKILFIFPSRYLFAIGSGHDGALTLSGAPFQGTWAQSAAEDASPDYNSNDGVPRVSSWALPGSLAVTRGILCLGAGAIGSRQASRDGPDAREATQRAEISVAESRLVFSRDVARECALFVRVPWRDSRWGLLFHRGMVPAAPGGAPGALPTGRGSRRKGADGPPPPLPQRGAIT